ncbi:hypothetical protein BSP109_02470 [Brevibacterium sp. Mu109]|nr:hypothetical protein BSP109_02470 [Brevibacterium sp. Mu109]
MAAAGLTRSERNADRLDQVEEKGRLVIGRGPAKGVVVRIVVCVLIGLLGLVGMAVGAESMMSVVGFLLFVAMGLVVPYFVLRQHGQEYNLVLTPEDFAFVRYIRGRKETLHRATWVNVRSVGTLRVGYQLGSMSMPSVMALGASGVARRQVVRKTFTGELRGERILLYQPLAISRPELVDLLTDAKKRFGAIPDGTG